MHTLTRSKDAPASVALWSAVVGRTSWPPVLARRTRSILPTVLLWLVVSAMAVAALGQEPGHADPVPPPKADTPVAEEGPADQEHVIVEGQVTDLIGAGHTDVTVTVRWKTVDDSDGELIATTTTNDVGEFKVTSQEPVHGDIVVTFSKPMYTDIVRELHVGDSEWPEFLAEQFEGNLVLIGRVTDALTDDPVAGASVTLEALYHEWYATTDENGRFAIKGVVPGRGVLIVEREGYGREKQPVRKIEDFGEIPVRLKPERVIHLKTVDEAGKPIGGVTVECYDQPRDDFRTLVTDTDGSITMRGIHFDAHALSVRLTHEDHVSSLGFDRRIMTPEETTESTHELVMERAGRITGRIISADSGEPLYGARLVTGTEYSDDSPRDWTDYEGNYTIRGVRTGSTTVTVHFSGYAPHLEVVDVQVGEPARLDIKLRTGAVLRGVVKTESGKTASGVYVEATHWRGARTLGLRAVTDDDGTFVLENAPHDAFELTLNACERGRVISTVKAGGDQPIEFTVSDPPVGIGSGNRRGVRVGDIAPPLSMIALDGRPLKLSDFKGKTVLLGFWATWCGPCLADVPHMLQVFEKFGKRKDFVIIAVSLDSDEKALRDFIEKRRMSWHHVCGEADGAQTAVDRFGVNVIPLLFIIGPEGRIITIGLRGADIVRQVERILQEDDPT